MIEHEFEVRFTLKSSPQIKKSFEGSVKVDDFELEEKEGKIAGKTSISIDSNDPALGKRQAFNKIEELATILTLILGTAYVIDDLNAIHKPIIKKTKAEQIVSVFDTARVSENIVIIQKLTDEYLKEQYNIWRDILDKSGDKEHLIRALKWWRKGSLDEDKVDRFLHYWITLEILAYILKKDLEKEFEEFCKETEITCKPDGKHSLKWIRNKLVHSAGKDKEKAEELAKNYADTLGNEIFKVIKRIIKGVTHNT